MQCSKVHNKIYCCFSSQILSPPRWVSMVAPGATLPAAVVGNYTRHDLGFRLPGIPSSHDHVSSKFFFPLFQRSRGIAMGAEGKGGVWEEDGRERLRSLEASGSSWINSGFQNQSSSRWWRSTERGQILITCSCLEGFFLSFILSFSFFHPIFLHLKVCFLLSDLFTFPRISVLFVSRGVVYILMDMI